MSAYQSFFYTETATTQLYTLSLHDALPISRYFRPIAPLSRITKRVLTGSGCTLLFSRRFRTAIGCPAASRPGSMLDRKSTRLNSSHVEISYAVFCLKKKNNKQRRDQRACVN